MRMGILLSIALTVGLVTSAAAAPTMTMKGHKSLSFEADTDSPVITFGWNVADMTKLNMGVGLTGLKEGAPEGAEENDTQTNWAFQGGISRYLGGLSNNMFAPLIGAQMRFINNGEYSGIQAATQLLSQDMSYEFRGFFGVEAFVIDNLSIGGNVGVGYAKDGTRPREDADFQESRIQWRQLGLCDVELGDPRDALLVDFDLPHDRTGRERGSVPGPIVFRPLRSYFLGAVPNQLNSGRVITSRSPRTFVRQASRASPPCPRAAHPRERRRVSRRPFREAFAPLPFLRSTMQEPHCASPWQFNRRWIPG